MTNEATLRDAIERAREIEGWWAGDNGMSAIIDALHEGYVKAAMGTKLHEREAREAHYLMAQATQALKRTIEGVIGAGRNADETLKQLREIREGKVVANF